MTHDDGGRDALLSEHYRYQRAQDEPRGSCWMDGGGFGLSKPKLRPDAVLRLLRDAPTLVEMATARAEETPGSAEWCRKHADVLARTPTLGEAASGDPLQGVPLRGLFWLSWAATKAGLRDAWRRLRAGGLKT